MQDNRQSLLPRKPLLLLLLCLALIEAGVLLSGYFAHRHDSASVAAQPAARALSAAPTLSLFAEPDANFTWLYTLVNNAKSTLDLTMYELVDTTFSADLVAACQRGVKVRVILDGGTNERSNNTPAFNQLTAAAPNCTPAWSNPQFAVTHEKSLVIDNTTAVIMTFNTTSRFYSTSRDFGLVTADPADVAAIETTFNSDFQSTTDFSFQPPAGTDLIWSPTTATTALLSIINNAKSTLLAENEELGAPNIVSAMAAACKRGVKLSLAMTDTSTSYHANYTTLEQAGCGVHIGANNPTTLYIHAKALVADLGTPNAIGYLGSINFSTASMTKNRELGLFLHDPATLQQLASTLTADYNSFPAYTAAAALPNTLPARP